MATRISLTAAFVALLALPAVAQKDQDVLKKKLADKLGNATSDWIKKNTPKSADEWVDKFAMEAKAAVAANPMGSNWLEKTDCAAMEPMFTKYVKKKS